MPWGGRGFADLAQGPHLCPGTWGSEASSAFCSVFLLLTDTHFRSQLPGAAVHVMATAGRSAASDGQRLVPSPCSKDATEAESGWPEWELKSCFCSRQVSSVFQKSEEARAGDGQAGVSSLCWGHIVTRLLHTQGGRQEVRPSLVWSCLHPDGS